MEALTVEVAAPGYVKEAFDAVQNAAQALSKTVGDAKGLADEKRLKAEGEAKAVVQSALVGQQPPGGGHRRRGPIFPGSPAVVPERSGFAAFATSD